MRGLALLSFQLSVQSSAPSEARSPVKDNETWFAIVFATRSRSGPPPHSCLKAGRKQQYPHQAICQHRRGRGRGTGAPRVDRPAWCRRQARTVRHHSPSRRPAPHSATPLTSRAAMSTVSWRWAASSFSSLPGPSRHIHTRPRHRRSHHHHTSCTCSGCWGPRNVSPRPSPPGTNWRARPPAPSPRLAPPPSQLPLLFACNVRTQPPPPFWLFSCSNPLRLCSRRCERVSNSSSRL